MANGATAVWQKWGQLCREMGMTWAFWYVIHKWCQRIGLPVHAYRFAYQPVPNDRLLKKPDHIEFRWLDSFDPAMLVEDRRSEWVQARLIRGDRCLAAFKEGQLIAFLWLARQHYPEDEARCDYQLKSPHLAWDYDVYVAPKYRATRLFAQLWDEANHWLQQQGVRWTVSRISAFNGASIHAHQRRGAMISGAAIFIRIGKVQILLSNRRPFFHLSRRTRAQFRFFAPQSI